MKQYEAAAVVVIIVIILAAIILMLLISIKVAIGKFKEGEDYDN